MTDQPVGGRRADSSDAAAPDPERVTVFFEDGQVTLLPRRAPVGNSAPIRGQTLAVIPQVDAPNRSGGGPLAETVPLAGASGASTPRYPATIEPGSHPATALLGLTEAEATAMASALGLQRVFFWDGRRASLLTCPAAPPND